VDTDTDFCEDSEGTANDNTDDDLFASFTLSSATVTCGDAEFTMTGSGIWRNTGTFYPEVYGTFTMTGDEALDVECNIFIDENGDVNDDSTCSNADTGDSIDTLDNEVTCEIDAG